MGRPCKSLLLKCCLHIYEAKKVALTRSGTKAIAHLADGDFRDLINHIQKCYTVRGFVDEATVSSLLEPKKNPMWKKLILSIISADLNHVIADITSLLISGTTPLTIVIMIYKSFQHYREIEVFHRFEILRIIGRTQIRIASCTNPSIQLLGCIAKIIKMQIKWSIAH